MPNPYPAVIRDVDGTTRLGGEVDFTDPGNQPGGGGLPSQWTVDPATGGLVINNPSPAADFADSIRLKNQAGDTTFVTDSSGNTQVTMDAAGAQVNVQPGPFPGTYFTVAGVVAVAWDGAAVDSLGFYGAVPIARPVIANATAADLLVALAALGLVVDGT